MSQSIFQTLDAEEEEKSSWVLVLAHVGFESRTSNKK